MLLYFPTKFDENEWTVILIIIFNILLFRFLPKRLPKEITPLIVLLSISFPQIIDHTIGAAPHNYYDITDSKKLELFDILLYAGYPAFGYLFVYVFDWFHFEKIKLILYFITWSCFAALFEFCLVNLHVYQYNGWKLIFSIPIYLVVLSITYLFYQFAISYNQKNHN